VKRVGTRCGGGWPVAVVVVLAGVGGAPGAALAQAPSYQPDSPAGTEYAIPLDEARKTGSAASGTGGQHRSSEPQKSGAASDDGSELFGEGVAPAKRSSAAGGTSHESSKKTAKATASAPAAPSEAGHLRPTASGISGTAVALGTGGLVLALGAALTGAIVMSRRMPRSR
jgi:hypothetical protein